MAVRELHYRQSIIKPPDKDKDKDKDHRSCLDMPTKSWFRILNGSDSDDDELVDDDGYIIDEDSGEESSGSDDFEDITLEDLLD